MQLFEGQQKLSVLSKMYHIIISYSESHGLVDFDKKLILCFQDSPIAMRIHVHITSFVYYQDYINYFFN